MHVCDRLWLYSFEVHVVESVVGVTSAHKCGGRSNQLDIFGCEDCRESVVTKLAN